MTRRWVREIVETFACLAVALGLSAAEQAYTRHAAAEARLRFALDVSRNPPAGQGHPMRAEKASFAQLAVGDRRQLPRGE